MPSECLLSMQHYIPKLHILVYLIRSKGKKIQKFLTFTMLYLIAILIKLSGVKLKGARMVPRLVPVELNLESGVTE